MALKLDMQHQKIPGVALFSGEDREQEELGAGQRRKTIQTETTMTQYGVGAGWRQDGWLPLTWADSWVFTGKKVCLAVGTINDLQCGV